MIHIESASTVFGKYTFKIWAHSVQLSALFHRDWAPQCHHCTTALMRVWPLLNCLLPVKSSVSCISSGSNFIALLLSRTRACFSDGNESAWTVVEQLDTKELVQLTGIHLSPTGQLRSWQNQWAILYQFADMAQWLITAQCVYVSVWPIREQEHMSQNESHLRIHYT